jgi:hypothetical protein
VSVHLVLLGCGLAWLAIASGAFTPGELCQRAAHADEDHLHLSQDGQAVDQSPGLAEDVVGDDVVASHRHAGQGAVEARARPGKRVHQLSRIQRPRLRLGPHAVDRIHRQVEVRRIKHQQKLLGDAGLSGAGGTVQQDYPTW